MNASKILFSLALLALLSACAPATVQTTRGPSIDAKAATQNVRGFSVGAFSGDLGGAFRERLLPALEGRGFVVTFAEARATQDISDYLLLGNVEARVDTVTNGPVWAGLYRLENQCGEPPQSARNQPQGWPDRANFYPRACGLVASWKWSRGSGAGHCPSGEPRL